MTSTVHTRPCAPASAVGAELLPTTGRSKRSRRLSRCPDRKDPVGPRVGFTLVELLVVIAIIAMLIGLLLPAVAGTRKAMRRALCANNMRQIGLGIVRYCENHNGRFPMTMHTSEQEEQSWVVTLAPYLENNEDIRGCPDDLHRRERLANGSTSYVFNGYLAYEADGATLNRNSIRALKKTMMLFEGADARDPKAITAEHTHSPSWFKWYQRRPERVWEAITAEVQVDRHTGGANYIFADAHVEYLTVETVKAWADKGFDFARPQR